MIVWFCVNLRILRMWSLPLDHSFGQEVKLNMKNKNMWWKGRFRILKINFLIALLPHFLHWNWIVFNDRTHVERSIPLKNISNRNEHYRTYGCQRVRAILRIDKNRIFLNKFEIHLVLKPNEIINRSLKKYIRLPVIMEPIQIRKWSNITNSD